MAVYELSELTNATDILGATQALNSYSEGTFGVLFYLTVLIITFGSITMSQRASPAATFAFTTWIGVIISTLMVTIGFLDHSIRDVTIVMAILALGLLYVTTRNN